MLTWALAMTSAATAHPGPRAVPEQLKVPQPGVPLFEASATGIQIYVCKAREDDADAFEWAFKAPVAELWNASGELSGVHYAGPTWEGIDGSTVTGQVVARAEAPDSGAIPWLLLKASATTGTGSFGRVTYIQRLDTVGGQAPTDGCDRATLGSQRNAEYSAIYVFYGQPVETQ
ncbi:MAG: DUF3455 domain-containing protein [Chloroflexota bacterium]